MIKRWLVFSACMIASWLLLGYLGWVIGIRNLEIAVIGGACFVSLRWLVRRAIQAEDQADFEARANDLAIRKRINSTQVSNGRKVS